MEQRKRRILVAVDESSESMEALRWGLKNLFHPSLDDLLILLHIQSHSRVLTAPGSPIAGFDITPDVLQAVGQRQDEASKTVLAHAKQICCENKVASETMVAHGDPREAICEAVKRLQVDFLVMGSHGYGAFKRAYLGSVSDYCAHNAKCPVVIVKKQ